MGFLLDALRSVEFLDGAGDAAATRFMVLGSSAEYPKGHRFWSAGAVPKMLVVPITGESKTSRFGAEGRELIDRFLRCGECMGLAGALGGLPHASDAHVTRAGEFFAISRLAFARFLDDRPAVRAKATEMLCALYGREVEEREHMALRPVAQRIAEFLLRHGCSRAVDGARVLVHATQMEIAARLGTVREVVTRVLGDFEERGIIGRDDHGILVCDWEGLEAEADGGRDDRTTARGPRPEHAARTRRYFLPMDERRRRQEPVEDASSCRDRLGDLSLCRMRGCPAALEHRPSPAATHRRNSLLARPLDPAGHRGRA